MIINRSSEFGSLEVRLEVLPNGIGFVGSAEAEAFCLCSGIAQLLTLGATTQLSFPL